MRRGAAAMKWKAGAVAASLFIFASGAALGCGFEDPSSVRFQRGVLNLAFPKALWVSTAVWQAQAEGLLERSRFSPANRALLGFRRASDALSEVARKVDAARSGEELPSFTLVMIGPVLWTRFSIEGDRVRARPHVSGPSAGDVVIVSDEPVVIAMAKGRLGAERALSSGLIRLYGDPVRVAAVERALRQAIGAPSAE